MSIRVENLSFSYKKDLILKDISFEVKENTLLCMLGKNGAGKSTLFKSILGLLKPNTGRIYIDDIDINTLSSKEISQKIAYIPQNHNPHFNYKVIDIVIMEIASRINMFSNPKMQDFERANQILEYLGISNLAQRGYMDISGGERQLSLISRAILQNSKILIMDEPTSNLDFGNQIKLMKKIKKLSQEGYIVILSTHNPQQAVMFCDKALILKEGKLLSYGDTSQTLTKDVLKSIYNIDIDICDVNNTKVCIPII